MLIDVRHRRGGHRFYGHGGPRYGYYGHRRHGHYGRRRDRGFPWWLAAPLLAAPFAYHDGYDPWY